MGATEASVTRADTGISAQKPPAEAAAPGARPGVQGAPRGEPPAHEDARGLQGKHGWSPRNGRPPAPTFLLNSIGHGFLDSSGPHDGRVRVGIIRHGHCNKRDPQRGGLLPSASPRRPAASPAPSPASPRPAARSPRPEQASWARNLSRFPRLGMAAGSGRGRPSGPGPRAMSWAPEPAPGAAGQRHPAPWPSRAAGPLSRGRRPGSASQRRLRPPWTPISARRSDVIIQRRGLGLRLRRGCDVGAPRVSAVCTLGREVAAICQSCGLSWC